MKGDGPGRVFTLNFSTAASVPLPSLATASTIAGVSLDSPASFQSRNSEWSSASAFFLEILEAGGARETVRDGEGLQIDYEYRSRGRWEREMEMGEGRGRGRGRGRRWRRSDDQTAAKLDYYTTF